VWGKKAKAARARNFYSSKEGKMKKDKTGTRGQLLVVSSRRFGGFATESVAVDELNWGRRGAGAKPIPTTAFARDEREGRRFTARLVSRP
jgi:hypothetical protein